MQRDSLVRIAAWTILYGILLVQTYRYAGGIVFYGEYLHWTGLWSARLLLVALAVTPLRRLFPTIRWLRWLSTLRRDIGVAVFVFALAHTVAYLHKQPGLQDIVEDSVTAGILTGWLALLVFVPLAVTSNDASVRALGRRWKTLHRLVYLGALLTLAHWIITAFDPTAAYVHLAVLLVLLGLRAIRRSGSATP